jgi:hypothetical protein
MLFEYDASLVGIIVEYLRCLMGKIEKGCEGKNHSINSFSY